MSKAKEEFLITWGGDLPDHCKPDFEKATNNLLSETLSEVKEWGRGRDVFTYRELLAKIKELEK